MLFNRQWRKADVFLKKSLSLDFKRENNNTLETLLNQFKLGNFIIDTDRCQIKEGDKTTSVEPKVMDTLSYLAKYPNKVISGETLFSAVWPDAIYNPSSIQRSIAVLRKAFGEGAKNPKIIITHPKRGYSLEALIETIPHDSLFSHGEGKNKLRSVALLSVVVITVVLLAALLFKEMTAGSEIKQYSKLTPVVSTGKDELNSRFSPDGQYLAYIARETGENYHIWVKNLRNSQVSRLTEAPAKYISINWTYDQQAIGFVERHSMGDRVGLLPFNRYQLEPSSTQTLLSLNDEYILSQVQWEKNGDVIYLSRDKNQRVNLMRHSIESNLQTFLLGPKHIDGMFDVALSNDGKVLAIVNNGKPNQYPISLYDLETKVINKLAVLTGNIFGLNWHPNDQNLLVSNRSKLKVINLSGEVDDLKFTNYLNIANASYSPDGNEITFTLFGIDFDILSSNIDNMNTNNRVVDSNSIDMQPLFSPDSKRFAFVSLRAGNQQVFIYENGIERLLFENSESDEFFGMAWSPDGNNLAIALEKTLYIVGVNEGNILKSVKLDESTLYLRGWYNNENALLVNLPGPLPAKFDLDSFAITQLSEEVTSCIALDRKDNLYLNLKSRILKRSYNGEESIFWQVEEGEIEHLHVTERGLILELKSQKLKQLLKIDFEKQKPLEYFLYDSDEKWLSDVSADGQRLLSMKRSNFVKTIFTLE